MSAQNIFANIVNIVLLLFSLFILVAIAYRIISEKFSKAITVRAVVVDKQKFEHRVLPKAMAPYSGVKCVITFLADGKRLSFYVSEFSYDGYGINEKGTLTYKKGRIIDFSQAID
jgi:hypothetical protein